MAITRINISQTEYRAIHFWIAKEYGRANKCENPDCENKSKSFQWALIKGKEHSRNIDNYKQLCASCHNKYDCDDLKRERMKKAMLGKNAKLNTRQVSIIRHSYNFGSTIKDLARAFSISQGSIFWHIKGIVPDFKKDIKKSPCRRREPQRRKYNPTQINVMKSARKLGVSYSDLSRIFNGSDSDRANIYKVINGLMYV